MKTPRIMLVEISTSLLFTITYLRFGFSPAALLLCIICAILIIIAVIDIEHGLILNRIMLPSLTALLLLAPFWPDIGISRPFWGNSSSLVSLTNSLIAGGGAFLVFLTISLVFPQSIGEGDPKMAGLVGLMVGFPEVLFALWGAVVSGGIVCSLLIALHKKKTDDTIPFGTFLSLGGIIVILARPEIIRVYQVIVNNFNGS
jgi:prepilin signal peptidase PulO-like enzyme (type II secretory pathway)